MFADFDIRRIVLGFLAITIAVTFHEFGHAIVADKLGDDTPRRHGRITLNPIVLWKAHPIGTIVAPLFGAMNGMLFGWAATPINLRKVRRDVPMSTADFLVSIAGPAANLILAVFFAILYRVLIAMEAGWAEPLISLCVYSVITNIILMLFNLFPVPPLDGYSVLSSKAPRSWAPVLGFVEQYSMMFFVIIFMYGGRMIGPAINSIASLLLGR